MILAPLQNLSSQLLKDRLIKISLFLSLLINFGLWLLLFWQSKSFALVIPLHYNIYFGIDFFGPWYWLFLLPALGLGIIVGNFLMALFFYSQKILGYFLITGSMVIQIFLSLAWLAIMTING